MVSNHVVIRPSLRTVRMFVNLDDLSTDLVGLPHPIAHPQLRDKSTNTTLPRNAPLFVVI